MKVNKNADESHTRQRSCLELRDSRNKKTKIRLSIEETFSLYDFDRYQFDEGQRIGTTIYPAGLDVRSAALFIFFVWWKLQENKWESAFFLVLATSSSRPPP